MSTRRMPMTIRLAVFVVVAGLAWYGKQQKTQKGDAQVPPADPVQIEAPESLVPTGRRETSMRAAPPAPKASAALQAIPATQENRLKSLKGQTVMVTGRLDSVNQSSSGHYFLNFQGTTFKAVCFKDDAANFSGSPGAGLVKQDVALSGTIEIYKDHPQIKLMDPAQLKAWDPNAIDAAKGRLEKVGRDHWVSPAGLHYKGRDSEGLTRMEHVLRHAKDIPGRAGSHGVFDSQGDAVFALIDQAWEKAETSGIRPKAEGHTATLLVPMGRTVGFLGGRTGAQRNHPKLSKVFIVIRTGTKEIITAYPRS